MRAPAVAALSLTLISCTPSYPVPPGAQLACDQSDDCPSPLLCDLELGRCVDTIIKAPVLTLAVDRTEGTRNDVFTFTSTSADAPLRYAWEVLDDATGDATVLVADGSATLLHRFALQQADFCTPDAGCSSVLARTVRVTATNAGGKSSQRQVSVVVKNGPPIAHFGEDLFISEDGVPEVELDLCGGVRGDAGCTSRDPDGDQIRFGGFVQTSGPAVTLRDAGFGRVHFAPPAAWQRPLIFEGVVSDEVISSTGRVRVFRGSHAWASPALLDQTFRLHPDFRAVTSYGLRDGGQTAFNSPEAIEPDGTGGWWFGDSEPNQSTVVVHLDARLNELERWEEPLNRSDVSDLLPSLVPPRGNVPGCAAFRHVDSGGVIDGQSGFLRFARGQPLLAVRHIRPPIADGGPRIPLAVLPLGSGSDCWALGSGDRGFQGFNSFSGEVGRLQADGTWVPVATLAGYPSAWTVEPDGTLWLTERSPVLLPDGGLAPPVFDQYTTELRRFTPAGVASTIDTGGRYLTQLAAHPAGGIWALDARARQLARIRPDGSLAMVSTPPLGSGKVFTITGMAVDPASHALWVNDTLGEQLNVFSEEADGGLRLESVLTPEDLPEGVNKKGFGGRIAIDPVSGSAATFVGALSSSYARWVVMPSHARHVERSGHVQTEAGIQRGDPASGHLWLSNTSVVRRVDLSGRVLVAVPNTWAGGAFPAPAPLLVDRRGRAWVVNTEGQPALRAVDTDGREVDRVMLPFNPSTLTFASSTINGTIREVACTTSSQGSVARVTLATHTVDLLQLPVGSSDTPYQCAPTSSGRAWVLTNQIGTNRPHRAYLFEPGATMSTLGPLEVEPGLDSQVTGSATEEATGDLYFITWRQSDYNSSIVRASVDGGVGAVRLLQGFVPGEGNRLGIGLGVKTRRVCTEWVPACVELWVQNRVSEVHRFDGAGADLETFVFGRGEPAFDLVP